MSTKLKVFISYARADGSHAAQQLHDELERVGFDAWLDKHDIKDGENWNWAIDRALEEAHCLVVIITPGIVRSLQVESEWMQMVNRYFPVIPLYVETCEIPRILAMINYVDFRADFQIGLSKLIQRLTSLYMDHRKYLEYMTKDLQEQPDNGEIRKKIEAVNAALVLWHKMNIQSENQTETLNVIPLQDTKPILSISAFRRQLSREIV